MVLRHRARSDPGARGRSALQRHRGAHGIQPGLLLLPLRAVADGQLARLSAVAAWTRGGCRAVTTRCSYLRRDGLA